MLCFYGAKYMKNKSIYALGFFDGVHLGHQALLAACQALATEYGCTAGAVTFSQHPVCLVSGSRQALINTAADRRQLLTAMGAQTLVTLPFDDALMRMSWRDFIRLLRSEYGAAGFVCGDDFRFGHAGEGNAAILHKYCRAAGLPCAVIPQKSLDGIRVSSSYIRSLLEAGNTQNANRFLGHPHILSGTVVPGKQLGRTIGIPTANLLLPQELLVPKFGVYATLACFDGKKYPAVTNIGTRPTVEGQGITVEPWILDFDGDLYGKNITLEFHQFLRPEQKFETLEQLKAEIQKNAAQTRNFFQKT